MIGFVIGMLGALLVSVGAIWIIVVAFTEGDILMGVLSIICGIVTIIYGIQHMDRCKIPLILMGVGMVIAIIGNVALGGAAAVQ